MNLLLEKGALLEAEDASRQRPIHYAAECSLANIKFLLDKGADARKAGRFGETALHVAAR